jgi:O-antigen/teichoic acid export membrane protein
MQRRLTDKIKLVLGGNLIESAVLFLSKVVFVRLASLAVYGLYRQVLLVVEMSTCLFQGGIPKSIFYFFPSQAGKRRAEFVTQSLGLMFASGIIIWLGLYLFSGVIATSYFHQPELGRYLSIIAWWVPCFLSYSIFIPLLLSSGREEFSSGVSLAGSLARNLGVVIVYILTGRLDMALWYLVLLGAAQCVYMITYCFRRGLLHKPSLNRELIRQQLRHAIPLSLSKLTGNWAKNLDRLLISFFLPADQFAIYSIGATGLPFINSITYSMNNVLLPRYVTLLTEGRLAEFRRLWHKATIGVARIIFPLFVFLFVMADLLIRWLYSARYGASVGIFRIYLLSLPLYFTGYGVVLRAVDRTDLILKYTLFFVSANLVISLILFKCLGMAGPALSTVACNYGIVVGYVLTICRTTGLSLRELFPYRELGRLFVLALICGIFLMPVLRLQVSDFWLLAIGTAWFGGCYLVCGHLSGIMRLSEVRALVSIRSQG